MREGGRERETGGERWIREKDNKCARVQLV